MIDIARTDTPASLQIVEWAQGKVSQLDNALMSPKLLRADAKTSFGASLVFVETTPAFEVDGQNFVAAMTRGHANHRRYSLDTICVCTVRRGWDIGGTGRSCAARKGRRC